MFPDLIRDDVFRLETRHLWLRWPRAADAAAIARLAGDGEVAEQTAYIPHPYPPGAAAEFVLKARAANFSGTDLVLVLTLKQRPAETIGCIGLHQCGEHEAFIGYWLGKAYWAQGLMSEAVEGLIDLSFRVTDLSVITAAVRPGNIGSRRVLDHCGFTPTGSGVDPAPARGGAVPVDRFALSRSNWTGTGDVRGARAMQIA